MNIIKISEEFAKKEYAKHDPIHQWIHIQEVMKLALKLAKSYPETDLEILKLAVIFHDISYAKYETHVEESMKAAESFLQKQSYPAERIKKVTTAMLEHSSPHRKKIGDAKSIEGKILFDSDKFRATTTPIGFKKYFPLLYLEETRNIIRKSHPEFFQ